jgi:ribosomal protein S18 acetylase RimI-like enzyme
MDDAVVRANPGDAGALAELIAEAFAELAPSRWLIPDADARRRVFPGYFRLYVDSTMTAGVVHTTPARDAVALWLPVVPPAPSTSASAVSGGAVSGGAAFRSAASASAVSGSAAFRSAASGSAASESADPVGVGAPNPAPAPPAEHSALLAAATRPFTARFEAFDAAIEGRHPAGAAHWHLAILAVRPGCQGRGLGSALLRAQHDLLDRAGTPAYLESSSERARALYRRHGYADLGAPIILPDDGPPMWPMWRAPDPTQR